MNKAIYKQADSRWGSKPYPTKGSSFAGNGCGCCACTHLVIEQDKYKNYITQEKLEIFFQQITEASNIWPKRRVFYESV